MLFKNNYFYAQLQKNMTLKLTLYTFFHNLLSGTGIGRTKLTRLIIEKMKSRLIPEYVNWNNFRIYLDATDHFNLTVKPYTIPKIYDNVIKSGDIVVDVGANMGIHTLYFSRLVGPNGKVYSFEPDPTNFTLLKKNIVYNQCNNVILEQKAVSDKNSKVKLTMDENKSMAGHRISTIDSEKSFVYVDSITLDDYFKNNLQINFLKIDAEGYDGYVIKGGHNLILSSKPLNITLEFHNEMIQRSKMSPKYFFEQLVKNDLIIYDMKNDIPVITNFEKISKNYDEKKYYLTNLFCTHFKNIF